MAPAVKSLRGFCVLCCYGIVIPLVHGLVMCLIFLLMVPYDDARVDVIHPFFGSSTEASRAVATTMKATTDGKTTKVLLPLQENVERGQRVRVYVFTTSKGSATLQDVPRTAF
eukprot:1590728-Amphidinium_carterae.1